MTGAVQGAGLRNGDPSTWGDTEEDDLIDAILGLANAPDTLPTIASWGGPGWSDAYFSFDPTAFDPDNPRLERTRGSFVADDDLLGTPDF